MTQTMTPKQYQDWIALNAKKTPAIKGRVGKPRTAKQEAAAVANKAKRKDKSKLREACPTGKIYAGQLGLTTPVCPFELSPSQFFIPFSVVSKKNSKQAQRSSTGHTRVISSEAYLDYQKLSSDFWISHAPAFRSLTSTLPRPLLISFQFIRPTKGPFDFNNLTQGPGQGRC